MKKLILCELIAATGLLTGFNLSAAIMGTGTLKITAPGLPDVDGPYTVVTKTYAPSSPNLGTFETFCLGSQVDFVSGTTYNYSISTVIQPFATDGVGGLSYVALGTAYLYSEFIDGVYGSGSKNDLLNNELQQAIWYLQKQSGGVDNFFVKDAITALGKTDIENDVAGAYGVYALNLSPGNAPGDVDGYAQPELCMLPPSPQSGPPPVPEPGTIFAGAMLLLPLAASTFRILRKSKRT